MSMDFSSEVPHSSRLLVHNDKPFNAEPPLPSLMDHEYTPEEFMYCRNHGPVVTPSADTTLSVIVDGDVKNPMKLNFDDLKKSFPQKKVVAVLQCAGNRRKTMSEINEVEGIPWQDGTVANIKWTGFPLREVLEAAGVNESIDGGGHVCFASYVAVCQEDSWYGASIPLAKALDPEGDVLLAFEMNGRPLSVDHGYPLRVVIPGYCGARWVKWVHHITVAKEESPNFYQKNDYKILPPEVDSHDKAAQYWPQVPPLQELWLNSAIASASLSSAVEGSNEGADPRRKLRVRGYAVPSPHAAIAKVEVSADRGATWHAARETYREGRWSWVLWEAAIDISPGTDTKDNLECVPQDSTGVEQRVVWSRAWDESGEIQTRRGHVEWNLRGVAYNGYGECDW